MKFLIVLASLPRMGTILAPMSLVLAIVAVIATGNPLFAWGVFVGSMALWMVQEIAYDVVRGDVAEEA